MENEEQNEYIPSPGALEFKNFNGSVHDSIIIPQQHAGLDATTYIYRGISPPPKTTEFSCGNRCIWMWAHKNEGYGEKNPPFTSVQSLSVL